MNPLVAVIMGSKSDWSVMTHTSQTLDQLGIAHDVRALSAHRTPQALSEFISTVEKQGCQLFIAAAGGAAHLAGVVASKTTLPVLGVPVESTALGGMDSLLSTVQMPAGIPVATFAIGKSGAINAALCAAAILGLKDRHYREAVEKYRMEQSEAILAHPDPRIDDPH